MPPLAVVHHVGRKSRRHYRTPVVAFRTATGFVTPMTYGRDVDWARDLVKARGGELVQMGRHFRLRSPRVVSQKLVWFDLSTARASDTAPRALVSSATARASVASSVSISVFDGILPSYLPREWPPV